MSAGDAGVKIKSNAFLLKGREWLAVSHPEVRSSAHKTTYAGSWPTRLGGKVGFRTNPKVKTMLTGSPAP